MSMMCPVGPTWLVTMRDLVYSDKKGSISHSQSQLQTSSSTIYTTTNIKVDLLENDSIIKTRIVLEKVFRCVKPAGKQNDIYLYYSKRQPLPFFSVDNYVFYFLISRPAVSQFWILKIRRSTNFMHLRNVVLELRIF